MADTNTFIADSNQTDGQYVPAEYNDTELTNYKILVLDDLSVNTGDSNNITDVPAALAVAIGQAQAQVSTFNIDNAFVLPAGLPAGADVTTPAPGHLVVEGNFWVSGMNPRLFLGQNADDAPAFSAGDSNSHTLVENHAYVEDELYLAYTHPQQGAGYLKMSIVMTAMKGLLESVIDISPVKRSLHKFGYTVDFDVDAGVNIQVEDVNPDLILEGANLQLATDFNITISDDTADGITSLCTQAEFVIASNVFDTGTRTGAAADSNTVTERAASYEWAVNGMSANTLIKGLFGELLAESPIVSAFRDSNLNNIVAEDLFELVVKRPGKLTSTIAFRKPDGASSTYTAEYTAAGGPAGSKWVDQYFEYEHNQMMTELSDAFVNVWSDTDNADWYVTFFNVNETGPMFTTGDTFRVPVDLTLTYELADNGRDPATLDSNENIYADGAGKLEPQAMKLTNLVAGDVPKIQKTYRLEYVFNVTQN